MNRIFVIHLWLHCLLGIYIGMTPRANRFCTQGLAHHHLKMPISEPQSLVWRALQPNRSMAPTFCTGFCRKSLRLCPLVTKSWVHRNLEFSKVRRRIYILMGKPQMFLGGLGLKGLFGCLKSYWTPLNSISTLKAKNLLLNWWIQKT